MVKLFLCHSPSPHNAKVERSKHPGGGGAPIWNRQDAHWEILNLTPKGEHLGVAQVFCDPKGDQSGCGLSKF